MAIYRVEGTDERNSMDCVVLVRADSEALACEVILTHGVVAQVITEMRAEEIPDDAEIINANVPVDERILKTLQKVERSNLIRHPIKTIAGGILLAMVLFYLLLLLITLLFGGTISIG
jgi:hypothetical protein